MKEPSHIQDRVGYEKADYHICSPLEHLLEGEGQLMGNSCCIWRLQSVCTYRKCVKKEKEQNVKEAYQPTLLQEGSGRSGAAAKVL